MVFIVENFITEISWKLNLNLLMIAKNLWKNFADKKATIYVESALCDGEYSDYAKSFRRVCV